MLVMDMVMTACESATCSPGRLDEIEWQLRYRMVFYVIQRGETVERVQSADIQSTYSVQYSFNQLVQDNSGGTWVLTVRTSSSFQTSRNLQLPSHCHVNLARFQLLSKVRFVTFARPRNNADPLYQTNNYSNRTYPIHTFMSIAPAPVLGRLTSITRPVCFLKSEELEELPDIDPPWLSSRLLYQNPTAPTHQTAKSKAWYVLSTV